MNGSLILTQQRFLVHGILWTFSKQYFYTLFWNNSLKKHMTHTVIAYRQILKEKKISPEGVFKRPLRQGREADIPEDQAVATSHPPKETVTLLGQSHQRMY